MVVRLSDGGRLEMGEGQWVLRLDRRGRVVEVLRRGDPGYSHWVSLVRPGPASGDGGHEPSGGRTKGTFWGHSELHQKLESPPCAP